MSALFTPTASHDQNGVRLLKGPVVVLGPIDESTYDAADVGPMFRVRQSDGSVISAFGDELEHVRSFRREQS